jgi:hypothetical protein
VCSSFRLSPECVVLSLSRKIIDKTEEVLPQTNSSNQKTKIFRLQIRTFSLYKNQNAKKHANKEKLLHKKAPHELWDLPIASKDSYEYTHTIAAEDYLFEAHHNKKKSRNKQKNDEP